MRSKARNSVSKGPRGVTMHLGRRPSASGQTETNISKKNKIGNLDVSQIF